MALGSCMMGRGILERERVRKPKVSGKSILRFFPAPERDRKKKKGKVVPFSNPAEPHGCPPCVGTALGVRILRRKHMASH